MLAHSSAKLVARQLLPGQEDGDYLVSQVEV